MMSLEADFDALAYFSGDGIRHEAESEYESGREHVTGSAGVVTEEEPAADGADGADAEEFVISALDLPSLQSHPPGHVLHTILRLMKLTGPTNFGQATDSGRAEELLEDRGLEHREVEQAAAWLASVFSPLGNVRSLTSLSQQIPDVNSYLTLVISSPLSWVDDEILREQIWKEASLRLAQNCGRTAQPEFVRKIELSQDFTVIKLKEPSLTADNLGLKTWGSSLMLSKRLLKTPSLLVEPVLELGAGTGLIGITCALLGYQEVTLTDLPEIVPNLEANVKLNQVSENVSVEILDWSDSTSFKAVNNGKLYSTIILSDPIYSMQHPYWVVDMLKEFLHPQGTVLLQIPIRINFAKERELLWSLLSVEFTETHTEFEEGYDDFGEQRFVFKTFVYSSSI